MKKFFGDLKDNISAHTGMQSSAAKSAAKTVDREFEHERSLYKSFLTEAKDLLKNLTAQTNALKTWILAPIKDIDAGLLSIYGEAHPTYLSFQKATVTLDSAVILFDDVQAAETSAMRAFIADAEAASHAVAERDAKLAEMDKACATVFTLQGGRDAAKAQAAMGRYKGLKDEYEKVNAETLFTLRCLLHERPEKFDAHYAAALQAWDDLCAKAAALFAELGSAEDKKKEGGHTGKPLPPLPPKKSEEDKEGEKKEEEKKEEEKKEEGAEEKKEVVVEERTPMSKVEKFGIRMLPPMEKKEKKEEKKEESTPAQSGDIDDPFA